MSDKSGKNEKSHLPELVDLRLMRSMSNVVRQHILLAAVQDDVSPKELAEALKEGLSQISYHVTVLRDDCDGMLREARTAQRRGAVEHYYRADYKALLPAKAWRRIEKGLRVVIGGGMASDLFNDLADTLKAGKLRRSNDYIARTPLVLDAEGARNVKAIGERATEEVEREQQTAAKRLKKAKGKGAIGQIFALLSFEAAWTPANVYGGKVAAAESKSSSKPAGRKGRGKRGGGKAKGAGR